MLENLRKSMDSVIVRLQAFDRGYERLVRESENPEFGRLQAEQQQRNPRRFRRVVEISFTPHPHNTLQIELRKEEDEEKKGREEYCLLFEGEPMSLKLRHVLERLESMEADRNRNLASMLERENKWMDEGSTVRRMRVLVRYLMRTLDLIVDIGFDVFIRIVQFEVQDRCRKENVSEKSNAMLKDLRRGVPYSLHCMMLHPRCDCGCVRDKLMYEI